jgi:hypothetical protein
MYFLQNTLWQNISLCLVERQLNSSRPYTKAKTRRSISANRFLVKIKFSNSNARNSRIADTGKLLQRRQRNDLIRKQRRETRIVCYDLAIFLFRERDINAVVNSEAI